MREGILFALACCALLAATPARGQDAQGTDLGSKSLEDLMKYKMDTVYGASKFLQKTADAPASVTIVTAEEIQKYGYRTLADVLRGVPGFYVINDRNYSYVGVRGFSRPGDYNARILFLVDGHRVNDNIFDGTYVGTEFPVALGLIARIEIIRGPSSCLYGTEAFAAVINVITKRGRDLDGAEATLEAGSWDSYRGRTSYGTRLANGMEMLFSGSYYDSQGIARLYYPEFDAPATNNGYAMNADGDRSGSFFGDFIYRDLNVHVVDASRTKHIPTASFGTVFNDPRTATTDARGYVDAQYSHRFGNWETLGRISYDWYNYSGDYIYDYTKAGVPPYTVNKDLANGTWWDLQLDASRVFFRRHQTTFGTEYRQDLQQHQANYDVSPFYSYLNDHRGMRLWAYYVQDEYKIRGDLSLVAGLRSDWYDRFGTSFSPRVGVIYRPRAGTTLKGIYGHAFRAPNSYEQFYDSSNGDSGNSHLRPERMSSLEIALEQQLGKRFRLSASGYFNEIDRLITQQRNPTTFQPQYVNGSPVESKGLELEFSGRWPNGAEGDISYAFQRSNDAVTGTGLTNSPQQLAKAKFNYPLARERLFLGLEGDYTSRRETVAGTTLGGFLVVNATLFTRNLANGLDVSASVYNLFDKRYADSGGLEHVQTSIPQDGRSFRIKLTYHFLTRAR